MSNQTGADATKNQAPNGTIVPAAPADEIGAAMERVMVLGDLSPLTPTQRSEYYMRVCQSVGLNPYTKPFAYIRLNNKLTLYALRDCADQLRRLRGISIEIVDRKLTDGFLSVHVRATDKDGRRDEDYGVVPVSATLAGEAGANLIMKCLTKAKRRVTLSICGLGLLDETEVATIAGAEIVDVEGRHLATVEAPPKRKSSAAAKRDGEYETTLKPLVLALENATGETECTAAWTANKHWLSTAPSRWFVLALEAYVIRMKDFGVDIDPDEHGQESLREAA